MQAAEGTNTPQSFNPFLVEDTEPSLMLDNDSPTRSKPLQEVISYFQKDSTIENLNLTPSNEADVKSDDKLRVNQSLNLDRRNSGSSVKDRPPRPPPPVLKLPVTPDPPAKISCSPETSSTTTSTTTTMLTASEDLPIISQTIGNFIRSLVCFINRCVVCCLLMRSVCCLLVVALQRFMFAVLGSPVVFVCSMADSRFGF